MPDWPWLTFHKVMGKLSTAMGISKKGHEFSSRAIYKLYTGVGPYIFSIHWLFYFDFFFINSSKVKRLAHKRPQQEPEPSTLIEAEFAIPNTKRGFIPSHPQIQIESVHRFTDTQKHLIPGWSQRIGECWRMEQATIYSWSRLSQDDFRSTCFFRVW